MKNLKVKSIAMVATTLLAISAAQAPRAHAGVAVATMNPGLGAVASFMPFVGAATAVLIEPSYEALFVGTAIGIFVGLVLLDESSATPQLSFAELSGQTAQAAQITSAERQAYNAELPLINAITETISAEILESGDSSREFARSRWDAHSDSLSPEAYSALGEIATYILSETARKARN